MFLKPHGDLRRHDGSLPEAHNEESRQTSDARDMRQIYRRLDDDLAFEQLEAFFGPDNAELCHLIKFHGRDRPALILGRHRTLSIFKHRRERTKAERFR